jgi:hypothetical protein
MRLGLVLACAFLAAGCGGDPSAVDDYIKQVAQAQCQWEFRCCTDAEIKQKEMSKFMDEATCEKFVGLALTESLDLQKLGVRQGRLTVDKQSATACAAEQAMKACNPAPGTTPPPPMLGACTVDPCALVFKGSTPAGEACLLQGECAKGSHCVGAGNGAEGVCVPYQEENQICNSSSECDPLVCNLYCAHQDFQCHVRSPVGGPCAYTTDPVTGIPTTPLLLECDNSAGNVFCDPETSTCQTLPGDGEPCLSPSPPGVFNSCDPSPTLSLVCDQSTKTCRGPGMLGDNCSTIQCSSKAMLYCDHSTATPTCKSLPSLGQSCAQSGQCAAPYFCNFNMAPASCDQPAQLGQMCSFQKGCDTGLYCDTQTTPSVCKSKLADGATCTSSQMCLSSICNFVTGGGLVCSPSTTSVQCVGRM